MLFKSPNIDSSEYPESKQIFRLKHKEDTRGIFNKWGKLLSLKNTINIAKY